MSRPPKAPTPQASLSLRLPQRLIKALDAATNNFPGLTRAALVRNILEGWLIANGFITDPAGNPRKSQPAEQGGGADFARRSRRVRLED